MPDMPLALTLAEASDLVGDDIGYWLNNPFMTPELITEKVCWWIARAVAGDIPPEETVAEGAVRRVIEALRKTRVIPPVVGQP